VYTATQRLERTEGPVSHSHNKLVGFVVQN
jgi:hypothetical protein